MSDYVREKVLRLPIEGLQFENFKKVITEKLAALGKSVANVEDDLEWYTEEALPELWGYGDNRKFQWSPTYPRKFIDFILECEWGNEGEWGKVRELYPTEKEKYLPIFQKVLPELDNLDNVRLVEFCWYNCCEAPCYYDLKDDPFYTEV